MAKGNPKTVLAYEVKRREKKTFSQLAELMRELRSGYHYE